jgi:hypothetical protein
MNVTVDSKKLIENLSYTNLLKKWHFGTSKKLVIIRPNVPGDNYTAMFSFNAAEQVKTKAIAEGWTVTDLGGNNANRANNRINHKQRKTRLHNPLRPRKLIHALMDKAATS